MRYQDKMTVMQWKDNESRIKGMAKINKLHHMMILAKTPEERQEINEKLKRVREKYQREA